MPTPDTTARGVFLSYAREDTDAARRLAEALRAFGVEVWFDQSELRGGEAWDASIRKQIKECALFVPIISQQTEARAEGYFRREWKLAIDRTLDMAGGRAFLVPVVIDATAEGEATVPEEFSRVQWTRLANGEPTPEFVAQIKRLLETPRKPSLKPGPPRPPTLPPEFKRAARKGDDGEQKPEDGRAARKPALAVWLIVAVVAGVGTGAAFLLTRKPAPPATPPPVVAESKPAATAVPTAPKASDKSIAVLPFANMSADKENEFFADGMHDDLITALAKVRDLKVISRTSVLAYRDTAARNLKKIAADLGVAHVLEGSVQRAGNRVRINLQLIDARTDAHLWAETYNRELNDIFAIQAELVQQVTGALKATLTAGEQDLLARRPTENQVAYDLYLRARLMGQAIGLNATTGTYEAVIALYEQAAVADPKFALPHVQASILHGTMYWFGNLDASPERRARVEAELEAAQRLAPDAPETHLARGSYEYTCRNDWTQALVEYRKAEAGLPNDAQLIYRMGIAHRRLGQYEEAARRFEAAISLNPNDLNVAVSYLEHLVEMRRYRRVVDEVGRFAALFPTDRRLLATRVRARYELDGDRPAFLRDMAALPWGTNDPHGLNAGLGEAMRSGDLVAAEKLLEDPRMPTIAGASGALSYPVSLLRARMAWLRGRPEDARRFADETIAHFRSRQWMPRQEPGALMGVALAQAYAGRHSEALRDARAALADQIKRDVYAGALMQNDYGQILLVCGRSDEALAALQVFMSGMLLPLAPSDIRFDPIWSRLKDDPRFEEILKSAKPL